MPVRDLHIALKACERCRGDIVPDEYGDRRCLQCGRPAPTEALVPVEYCACGCGEPVKGLYQRPDGGWRVQRFVNGAHAMHPYSGAVAS